MKSALTLTLAAALAAAAPPALSQPTYDQQQYERQLREYEAQQREYQQRRAAYEAAQREYEMRYGRGSYDRYYGNTYPPPPPPPPPPYYGDNRYDSRSYDPRDPYPDRYGYDDPYRYYADSPCERRVSPNRDANTVAGGLIGALAGAAIGSNVASDNARDEGAVLGAVAGAAVGASIGRSASTDDRYVARCDASGYYYTYDQTYPYAESRYAGDRLSGRYDRDYYIRQRCRLAVAPAYWNGRTDYRYVRVCPDAQGRYRITS